MESTTSMHEQTRTDQIKEFLTARWMHFLEVEKIFRSRGKNPEADFCRGVALSTQDAWIRVDSGSKPFGDSGLEDGIPESACSGMNCELKSAGIEIRDLMGAKDGLSEL